MDDNNTWYNDEEIYEYKKGFIAGSLVATLFTTITCSVVGYLYYTKYLKKS